MDEVNPSEEPTVIFADSMTTRKDGKYFFHLKSDHPALLSHTASTTCECGEPSPTADDPDPNTFHIF